MNNVKSNQSRWRKKIKWITREYVKVDRLACPWLIKKFVDTAEWTVYDALYAYCKEMVQAGKPEGAFNNFSTALFDKPVVHLMAMEINGDYSQLNAH